MRPSEQAPCVECGAPRRKNANKCRDCYNTAKRTMWRERGEKSWEICRSRRARDIRAHVATDIQGDPLLCTIMSCYLVRGKRRTIMAVTSRQAKEWARTHLGVERGDVIEDVCTLAEIDYNLTPIPLEPYGWKQKYNMEATVKEGSVCLNCGKPTEQHSKATQLCPDRFAHFKQATEATP